MHSLYHYHAPIRQVRYATNTIIYFLLASCHNWAMRKREPLTYEQALQYALRLLRQRSYSEAVLRQKLTWRGTSEEDTERVLAKLRDLNLVDDAAYARSLVRTESTYRHSSQRYIEQKLKQKGITHEIIDTSLKQAQELPDETSRAKYHGERYLKRLGELTFENKQKIMGYLYRKGFSSSSIKQALDELKKT